MSDSEPRLLAIYNNQCPLTGDSMPVVKIIEETTTVATLMEWHKRTMRNPNWKPEWFDVRVVHEAH